MSFNRYNQQKITEILVSFWHDIVYNKTLRVVFGNDTLRDTLGGAHGCNPSRWMIS